MRLLNVRTGKIEDFPSEDDFGDGSGVPRYAILSHTWGPEEISLADWNGMHKNALRMRQGYFKIKYLRYQAIQDGLEWVWIDTCCIDSRSPPEVDASINAMFRWYSRAAVCYAYLEDIAQPVLGASLSDALKRSRWFTRGWTLQELIAPPEVVFYSTGWEPLGSKTRLAAVLASFTGVDVDVLLGGGRALAGSASVSVAKRMSWMAGRKTTRPEDVAYCMMGIFDVNMPLCYGEGGRRAFRRLQEEVLRAFPLDHTLFAWGVVDNNKKKDKKKKAAAPPVVVSSRSDALPHAVMMDESDVFRWEADAPPLRCLLADSPEDFRQARDLVPMTTAAEMWYYGDETGLAAAAAAIRRGERGEAYGGAHHRSSSRMGRIGGVAPPQAVGGRGGGGVVAELPLVDLEPVLYHWRAPVQLAQLRWGRLAVLFCHKKGSPQEQLALALTPTGPASYGRTGELVSGSFGRHIWQGVTQPTRTFVSDGNGSNNTPRDLGHGDLVLGRWIVGSSDDLVTGEFRDERGHSFSAREGLVRVRGAAEGPLLWSVSALSETESLCIFIKRSWPRPRPPSGGGGGDGSGSGSGNGSRTGTGTGTGTTKGTPVAPAAPAALAAPAAPEGGISSFRNSASNLFNSLAESVSGLGVNGLGVGGGGVGGGGSSGSVRNSASSILSDVTGLGGTSGAVTATNGNNAATTTTTTTTPNNNNNNHNNNNSSSNRGIDPASLTSLGAVSIELWPLSRKVDPTTTTLVDAQGTTWFPAPEDEQQLLALAQREEAAPYRYVFRPPSDTWLSPAIGAGQMLLPMLTARMDRVRVSADVAVDVVDVVAALPSMQQHQNQTPRLGISNQPTFRYGHFS